MKFLSKLGQIILKGVEIYAGFAPIAQASFPSASGAIATVSKDLSEIADIIVQVEAVGQALQLPGDKKLLAAVPSVTQIVLQSSMLANHKISDPVLFKAGCTKIADGMADVLNSLHDNVDTINKA